MYIHEKQSNNIVFVSNISCIAFIILKVFMYTQNIDVGLFSHFEI